MQFITSGPFKGLPAKHFKVIYADPAWSFRTFNNNMAPHRSSEAPYQVMSRQDLLELPVGDLAAKDCALAMWVIGSHLDQALELGRKWGFTYKTDLFTWVKVGRNDADARPISMGFWSRKQTEMCLLFTRGKPSRLDAGVRQLIEEQENVIFAPKREHSRKPDTASDRIEKLLSGPYIELFGRRSRRNWSVWGDQSTKFDHVFSIRSAAFDHLLDGPISPPIPSFEGLLE